MRSDVINCRSHTLYRKTFVDFPLWAVPSSFLDVCFWEHASPLRYVDWRLVAEFLLSIHCCLLSTGSRLSILLCPAQAWHEFIKHSMPCFTSIEVSLICKYTLCFGSHFEMVLEALFFWKLIFVIRMNDAIGHLRTWYYYDIALPIHHHSVFTVKSVNAYDLYFKPKPMSGSQGPTQWVLPCLSNHIPCSPVNTIKWIYLCPIQT